MNRQQVYWEEVEPGDELVPLPKIADSVTVVKWAAAIGAHNPLMYEDAFARSQGLQRPLMHGQLKLAWLVHFVTRWMGMQGRLKRISCEYRGIDYPRRMKTMNEPEDGETWLCKGKVTAKYVNGLEHLVELELAVENGSGKITAPGKALVSLPSRAKQQTRDV
ncbi:MAG: hypothetical protein IBX68_10305 [Dehalococcoidia bacterium]|nr:hypothetical protein [Dehalococcoidia bacterium]